MKLVSLAQFSCPEVDLPLPHTLPLYIRLLGTVWFAQNLPYSKFDAANLVRIIHRCNRPGTEVHTNDWSAYRRVASLRYTSAHSITVQRHNFVDP